MYQRAFSSIADVSAAEDVDVTAEEVNISGKNGHTKNKDPLGASSDSSGDKDDDEDWMMLSAVAIGGIALIGVGLFMWMRRRK